MTLFFYRNNQKILSFDTDNCNWKRLGEGNNNTAYLHESERVVLKISHKISQTDSPERSVKIWNQINAHIRPLAEVVTLPDGRDAWICPYIEGTQASDDDISHTLIDIYNRTGRIIIDANVPNNFLKDTHTGQIVCIDIGLAVNLTTEADLTRSEISLAAWGERSNRYNHILFPNDCNTHPQTIKTIKALIYFKKINPSGQIDLSQPENNIDRLAKEYDESISTEPNSMTPEEQRLFQALINLQNKDLKKIPSRKIDIPPSKNDINSIESNAITSEKVQNKDLYPYISQPVITNSTFSDSDKQKFNICKQILNNYINSRGSSDATQEFTPSWCTLFFRKKALTIKKVNAAKHLINLMESNEKSLNDITQAFHDIINDDTLTYASCFKSKLLEAIHNCVNIVSEDRFHSPNI